MISVERNDQNPFNKPMNKEEFIKKIRITRSLLWTTVTIFFCLTAFDGDVIAFKDPGPKQVIIFKMDDLSERSQDAFQKVADIVVQKECKVSFGIIGRSCEGGAEREDYYKRVRDFVKTGRIEIWAHGYDHFMSGDTVTEFKRMPYQHQYDHFKKSLELVKEKCGITLRTFGSPGNRNDTATIAVVNQFPQIEVFLFPFTKDSTYKQFLLTSRVNMEKATGIMDYDYFVKNYNSRADREYMVLQGHPRLWKEEGMKVFIDIIDFLKSKDVVFMTPYEYYKFLKP